MSFFISIDIDGGEIVKINRTIIISIFITDIRLK